MDNETWSVKHKENIDNYRDKCIFGGGVQPERRVLCPTAKGILNQNT